MYLITNHQDIYVKIKKKLKLYFQAIKRHRKIENIFLQNIFIHKTSLNSKR